MNLIINKLTVKNILFTLAILISFSSFGQDYGNSADAIKLCTSIQTNNFTTDAEAERGLDRILSVIGASKRFVLQPCDNINNAVAASYKGIRYIFYDRDFMSSLNSGDNWQNLFILAHEVGHHINGHSLDLVLYAAEVVEPKSLANKRKQELEADEFAGFIIAKLGGSLSEANQVIQRISSSKDDTYSTHPARSKRLKAVSKGYNNANNNKAPSDLISHEGVLTSKEAIRIYEIGETKEKAGDLYGAINSYTNAAELNYTFAYFKRGVLKQQLKDTSGAINDLGLYIKNGGRYPWAYKTRAQLYYDKGDVEIALQDLITLTKVYPDYEDFGVDVHYSMGYYKGDLKDYYGAIAEYTKSIGFYPNKPFTYFNRGVSKEILKDYNGAIADYTKAIEIDPNYAEAYLNRGVSKDELKDYNGAISDYTKAIELDPNDAYYYYSRGLSKNNLKDYNGAIADYTKAIEIDPNYANAYVNRGISKENLGDLNGACADWKKAAALGHKNSTKWVANQCN